MSMRVLCVKEDTSLEVFEVIHVWYSNNIIGVGKGSTIKPIEGLLMRTVSGANNGINLYIKNLSMKTCNEICECLYQNGFVDIREYGPYEVRKY
ncbi:hypothetical protein RZO55_04790 [Clostridium boliviensis]|uniref:Uncharacterized protein n=1 Tax=Clostridium boliviensis TaxID=318465 RepID=A0ABU4GGZ3_9CLOT|nr:hypothetical protein [Clostridium boliviensis]MDW2796894.1 hypothetical protein [Clostridium boliviensis]